MNSGIIVNLLYTYQLIAKNTGRTKQSRIQTSGLHFLYCQSPIFLFHI